MLLDEPLANLDVHLRASMEREFARFHERTGTTMVYITHDQAEAMALADRIAVMDQRQDPAGRDARRAVSRAHRRDGRAVHRRRHDRAGRHMSRATTSAHAARISSAIACVCAARSRRSAGARRPRMPARAARCGSSSRRLPGVRARVASAIYQGGHFRVEAHVDARPDVMLHLVVPEPCPVAPGDAVNLAVDDGWVIPGTAAG